MEERGRKMQKKSSKKNSSKSRNVIFHLSAPEANAVTLAGDFNGWDVNSLPMKRDRQGTWKASVSLQPGKYEYRFWVDGAWQDDPVAQERISNPFGGVNCIRIVS